MRSPCSDGVSEELMSAAGMPRASRASTWSFISAISGLTTMVEPGRQSAGSW